VELELATERLRLRRWRDGDLEPLSGLNADPEVTRWLGDGAPMTKEESAELLARITRHWDEHGFGLFAAEERASGDLAGFVGLHYPTFLPEAVGEVEVGWRLDRRFWGRGLATEAARASVAYGFADLGLPRIVSLIRPENARSVAVARRLGMSLAASHSHPLDGYRIDVWALRSP
jgi:RimJ/RimL family protein N-acetyltransferase